MALHNDPALYKANSGVELNTNTYINNTAPINVTGSVSISGVGGDAINAYNEALLVAPNIETLIVSYLVPIGKKLRISGAIGSGIVDAIFTVKKNSNVQSKQRNNWCQRNVDFRFQFDLVAGDTVSLYVTHNNIAAQDFYGNIFGILDIA